MTVFVEYSFNDFKALNEKFANVRGGVPSVITRGINKLATQPVVKRCPKRCNKIKRGYEIPDDVAENLRKLADNEGVSMALLVQKKVVASLLLLDNVL